MLSEMWHIWFKVKSYLPCDKAEAAEKFPVSGTMQSQKRTPEAPPPAGSFS
jgi:hypothetical protein